jgi:hypothetical protein
MASTQSPRLFAEIVGSKVQRLDALSPGLAQLILQPAMIPDFNNVYGKVSAPHGLQPVLNAIENAVAGSNAHIYRSQFDGAETLKLRGESVNFEPDALNEVEHLFSGGVGGSPQEISATVRALSEALCKAGVVHNFEIYGDNDCLVERIEPKAE